MMNDCGFSLEDVKTIQSETKVGNTPLFELKNLTAAVRKISAPGKGARIFLKDEAANASGSFKARRASISAFVAAQKGYKGVIAATSGNYGAAVASQAAQRNLKCIIVQEVFDSAGIGQPEIVEKGRKCEAFGAEVIKLSVGPELFYYLLLTLENTGFFNASLYTPFGIKGVETLGSEIAVQVKQMTGKMPDAVVVTHAGGGNLTGTARGLLSAGCEAEIVACSVDLAGLHMASDRDFNRKSFTTGHTGFGVPFATWPDRVDVPRNAARSLRYMDDYLIVKQGEVFYVTELLAKMEGIERGPAGNTSVTGAVALAREMNEDQIIVVQETEYTGAGKHHNSQLAFAKKMGIEIHRGDPQTCENGKSIVIPQNLSQIKSRYQDMDKLRLSYLRNAAKHFPINQWTQADKIFVAQDLKKEQSWVEAQLAIVGN
jgi:cysteine synthase